MLRSIERKMRFIFASSLVLLNCISMAAAAKVYSGGTITFSKPYRCTMASGDCDCTVTCDLLSANNTDDADAWELLVKSTCTRKIRKNCRTTGSVCKTKYLIALEKLVAVMSKVELRVPSLYRNVSATFSALPQGNLTIASAAEECSPVMFETSGFYDITLVKTLIFEGDSVYGLCNYWELDNACNCEQLNVTIWTIYNIHWKSHCFNTTANQPVPDATKKEWRAMLNSSEKRIVYLPISPYRMYIVDITTVPTALCFSREQKSTCPQIVDGTEI